MVDVRLEGLSKTFNTPSGEVTAVDDIDISIEHGEFFTLVGPSGCGKTTTLRMIAGLEMPTSGKIFYDDEEVTYTSPQDRDIAMVFQNVALYPHMTNYENIGYGLQVRGDAENMDERIRETAELLEVSEVLDKKPSQLSGGQQQRIALGRAIIRDPNIILLDEPMSDLDAKLKSTLRVELQRLHEKIDTTMIYVTHDQNEAMTMSTRIALMNDGYVEQISTPDNMFNSPSSEFVAHFMGQPEMNIVDAELSDGRVSFDTISQNGALALSDDVRSMVHEEVREPSSRVHIGFRPQHAMLTTDPDEALFELNLDVWERIGTDYVIYTSDEEGNELRIVANEFSASDESTIYIEELTTWYIFDPETEQTLRKIDSPNSLQVDTEVHSM